MHRLPSLPPPAWRQLLLLPTLFCLSCSGSSGPALNPVEGRVLYKGEPAAGAVITFHPTTGNEITTVRPIGLVGKDGKFNLTTGQAKGAPAGDYTVTVIWSEEVGGKQKKAMSTEQPDTKDRLNGAYANRASSPFKSIQVKSGTNKLDDFQLK